MINKFRLKLKRYLYLHEDVFNVLEKFGITFGVNKRTLQLINKIVDEPSLNPDKLRKPRYIRKRELLDWLNRYGYINKSYNEWGFDVVGFKDFDNYEDHYSAHLRAFKKFQFYRLKNSIIPRPINATLSDDKFAFASYLEKISPGITPKVYLCVLRGANVFVLMGVL